jgi:Protein of unknown function (DUF1592)/Protein of unknown function (DUF1588)/Protein of unknown function (DUF1595)/Protein of unknown function (DUF1587)
MGVAAPWAVVALAALAGCTGKIGDGNPNAAGGAGAAGVSSGGPGASGGSSSGVPGIGPTNCVESPSPRVLRQLTPSEYRNTVGDLLRIANPDTTNIPTDPAVRGFTTNVTGPSLDSNHMDQYQLVGYALADRAMKESYAMLVPCQTQDNTCASAFLDSFGLRAFRRPFTADEKTRYLALFDPALTGNDFKTGVSLAIKSMLISPYFLLRSELGVDMGQGRFMLTPFETATALSYMYWGTMPDDALLASAQSGALANKTEIQAQAGRLLAEARGRARVASFFSEWLEAQRAYISSKDIGVYPAFADQMASNAVVNAMRGEEDAFVTSVVFDSTKNYSELFTADYTFVNDRLATFYGLPIPGTGDVFKKVSLGAGSPRGGLLTLGMFLFGHARTDESSPTQRGHAIRANFFCQDIPPPPPGVVPVVTPGTPGKTAREQILALTSTGACPTCHRLQDPIGFGLEGFDSVGLPRTLDNGGAVDTSGVINNLASASGPITFNGPKELANIIATSNQARACLATNYHRYSRGFDASQQVDAAGNAVDTCAVDKVAQSFVKGDIDIPGLFLQIALQDSFTARRSVQAVQR